MSLARAIIFSTSATRSCSFVPTSRIILRPTPARVLGEIILISSFLHPKDLTIALSSANVADMYTLLGDSSNVGNFSTRGRIGVIENLTRLSVARQYLRSSLMRSQPKFIEFPVGVSSSFDAAKSEMIRATFCRCLSHAQNGTSSTSSPAVRVPETKSSKVDTLSISSKLERKSVVTS